MSGSCSIALVRKVCSSLKRTESVAVSHCTVERQLLLTDGTVVQKPGGVWGKEAAVSGSSSGYPEQTDSDLVLPSVLPFKWALGISRAKPGGSTGSISSPFCRERITTCIELVSNIVPPIFVSLLLALRCVVEDFVESCNGTKYYSYCRHVYPAFFF